MATSETPSLATFKSQHDQADEIQKKSPVVAFYLKNYIITKAVEFLKSERSQGRDVSSLTHEVQAWFQDLEALKKSQASQLQNQDLGRQQYTDFALNLFSQYDNQYKNNMYSPQLVKDFGTVSLLFDAYSIFGKEDQNIEKNKFYVKTAITNTEKQLQAKIYNISTTPGGPSQVNYPSNQTAPTNDAFSGFQAAESVFVPKSKVEERRSQATFNQAGPSGSIAQTGPTGGASQQQLPGTLATSVYQPQSSVAKNQNPVNPYQSTNQGYPYQSQNQPNPYGGAPNYQNQSQHQNYSQNPYSQPPSTSQQNLPGSLATSVFTQGPPHSVQNQSQNNYNPYQQQNQGNPYQSSPAMNPYQSQAQPNNSYGNPYQSQQYGGPQATGFETRSTPGGPQGMQASNQIGQNQDNQTGLPDFSKFTDLTGQPPTGNQPSMQKSTQEGPNPAQSTVTGLPDFTKFGASQIKPPTSTPQGDNFPSGGASKSPYDNFPSGGASKSPYDNTSKPTPPSNPYETPGGPTNVGGYGGAPQKNPYDTGVSQKNPYEAGVPPKNPYDTGVPPKNPYESAAPKPNPYEAPENNPKPVIGGGAAPSNPNRGRDTFKAGGQINVPNDKCEKLKELCMMAISELDYKNVKEAKADIRKCLDIIREYENA